MYYDYRRIEGYENYIVSNYGKVYSLKRGKVRELKTSNDRDGYLHVCLCKDGKRKTFTVHVLVGIHFVGLRTGELTYDHIDRNKINNRADNIRLATKSEQTINQKLRCNNKLQEKNISSYCKTGTERTYWRIEIQRNSKCVFKKYLNKKKFSLADAIKVRDNFLHLD